jgi:protein gp37
MGEVTGIAWTDHTFNSWVGCQEVSEACDHCYARVQNEFRHWVDGWGPHGERKRTSVANWKKPLAWNRSAAAAGRPARVFCCSLADVFDNQIPKEWRTDLFELIAATPHLIWQLLTKRPENMAKMLPADWGDGYRNVWLGTTVESQRWANHRIPILLRTPAHLRFLSLEPLLERVDLTAVRWMDEDVEIRANVLTGEAWVENSDSASCYTNEADGNTKIGWAIIGGESGPKARPFHLGWARDLLRQCQEANTAAFVKQVGDLPCDDGLSGKVMLGIHTRAGANILEWPPEIRVREFPI